jgi:hypothetical protein
LEVLPVELLHLTNLKTLGVKDNPYLISPPREVTIHGLDAIKSYLYDVWEDEQNLKVITCS